MIGPPPGCDDPRNGRVKDLSGQLARLCEELGLPYFDTYAALMTDAYPPFRLDMGGEEGTPTPRGTDAITPMPATGLS